MGTRQLDTGTGYIFVAVFNSNNNACDSENKTSASDVPKVGFQVNVILVWLFSYIFFSVHHRVEGAFDKLLPCSLASTQFDHILLATKGCTSN